MLFCILPTAALAGVTIVQAHNGYVGPRTRTPLVWLEDVLIVSKLSSCARTLLTALPAGHMVYPDLDDSIAVCRQAVGLFSLPANW